ncbi:SMI1/KNR4 family protein [Streptomycetaceae bacterium NBC_01309]
MTDFDLAAFDAAWARFSAWLAANSPADQATLQPAATGDAIASLEARLGFPLHPELRALLERHNGVDENWPVEPDGFQPGGFLPIGHRFSDIDAIVVAHKIFVDFGEDYGDDDEDDLLGHAHQWVQVAHPSNSGTVFIDHRPGPTYGHVYEMGIGSGAEDATLWATSLSELFDRLADALRTGAPFTYHWPTVHEHPSGQRCIQWEVRVPEYEGA